MEVSSCTAPETNWRRQHNYAAGASLISANLTVNSEPNYTFDFDEARRTAGSEE
jgi:hypothetical protein